MKIKLVLNGQKKEFEIHPGEVLLDVLRRQGYKSVKEGCRQGECGVCTVLLDGVPVNSCLLPAARANGKSVFTVEGLAPVSTKEISIEPTLHPIQQAFLDSGAVQCGYCTPAMLLSAKALLDKNPNPTEDDIKLALEGVLCRCTGYVKIIDAVQLAAQRIKNLKRERK